MALIAVSTDDPGIARIFFDLSAIDPTLDEEDRIALAIEQAFAGTGPAGGTPSPAIPAA